MRYFIFHHQHKGMGIDEALKKEGWYSRTRNVDIALFDHVINRKDPEKGRGIVHSYYDQGATILTYPHGATGAWWRDSDYYPPEKELFANLVIGEGHKHIEEIMRPYRNHYVIGWSFCPIKEFQKPIRLKNILFAPIHGSEKNQLPQQKIDLNTRVYESLLKISNKYKITVRYLNPTSMIGIKRDSRIHFKAGKPDGSYDDIDTADLVIAEGTFMYLSVARGKPTIGMNQHNPCSGSTIIEGFEFKNWEKYKDYMAYPIDFDDASLEELIDKAIEKEQQEWKELFIGKELDSKHLVKLLTELREIDVKTRQ